MYKEITYYNNDGKKVFNRTVSFTGIFHEEKGYALYSFGKTISTRRSVNSSWKEQD